MPTSIPRDWGDQDDGCTILHVDMDAFFVSVSVAARPELSGRPVLVGGTGRSVVLAASYEARAFGVHAAMPMAAARRLCPEAVVLAPDRPAYSAASARLMAVLGEITPIVEQVSVDEAYLDVSGARRRLGPPARIGALIRSRVRAELGLACSVGVAGTKVVAKIASGMAKPDGLLVVPVGATTRLLRSLPLGALPGVGEVTAGRLARWGLRSVAEVADADPALLRRVLGEAGGRHLSDLARGHDPRPVVPVRQVASVGAETTFEADSTDRQWLTGQLAGLADRTAGELRSRAVVARTVELKVRTADWQTLARSRTLSAPTDVSAELHAAVRELLAGVELGGRAVRLLGVRAHGLSPAQLRQPTLDEAVGDPSRRAAEQAVDDVRRRFGAAALRPGTTIGAAGPRSTTAPRDADLS